MKKFFLFAAALVAAMTVNAAVWDFSVDSINTLDAVNALQDGQTTFKLEQKESSDHFPYVAVNYDLSNKAVAVLNFNNSPIEVKFEYSNSSSKTEVFKFYGTYLQIARKGAKMTLQCAVGDSIKLFYKSYGKDTEFAVIGAGADTVRVATVENAEGVIALKATDSEVIFDTSNPSGGQDQSCQLTKIIVGDETQAIDNVFKGEKAIKRFENGQLVIIKNGVKYNALGTKF